MSLDRSAYDAYFDLVQDQVRVGIIDCSLTDADDDRPLDERIVERLRLVGRMPGGVG